MKKSLVILVLGLLWCNTSLAEQVKLRLKQNIFLKNFAMQCTQSDDPDTIVKIYLNMGSMKGKVFVDFGEVSINRLKKSGLTEKSIDMLVKRGKSGYFNPIEEWNSHRIIMTNDAGWRYVFDGEVWWWTTPELVFKKYLVNCYLIK